MAKCELKKARGMKYLAVPGEPKLAETKRTKLRG
jgi:hypothetical protein